MPPTTLLLTPTARLARSQARAFAATQAAAGVEAWLPPKVLSFSAWLAELRQGYFLASDDPRVPIDGSQARILWQSLIDMDVFVGEPQVAELAERAWRRIHEFDLPRPEHWQALLLSEDSRRFQEWAARYRRACAQRHLVDEWAFAAELPELIERRLVEIPAAVTLAGFDLPMTPLQSRIVKALEAAGAALSRTPSPAAASGPSELLQTAEPDDELRAAAQWARARLEAAPDQQVAVVVPDLSGRLARVDRIFRQVFDPPGFVLAHSGPAAWHVSLGAPLRQWPLIGDALALLELSDRQVTQPQARRMIQSPFLIGWASEASARDQALVRLAREAPYEVTPLELLGVLEQTGANILAGCLGRWRQRRVEAAGDTWPSTWAARFQEELTTLGFGAGRPLDSREYQVLQRWHDLLEEFSALDLVTDRPLPRMRALGLLADRAGSAVFREQNPGVPVEILGVEEALGSRFDAIWLTTLDSETWPGAPQRDPLIPPGLQAPVPGSTADGTLLQARQQLAGLYVTAPLVVGSFSCGSAEESRQHTALLQDAIIEPQSPAPAALAAPMAASLDDWRAPEYAAAEARGGTTLLAQQSACPFRAFAERRLGARELTQPRPGLDAAQRGTVIHAALEAFWNGLADRAALASLSDDRRAARVAIAVEAAIEQFTARFRLILTPAGRALERRRTQSVVERWLQRELEREDFAVIAQEQPVRLELAGLSLTGKIDRVDRLPDGSTLLIDYKTGTNARSAWFPEPRIADPQLPAYAVALRPHPGAIAFARIRPEDLKFDGLAQNDTGTPGITPLDEAGRKFKELNDWSDLLTRWQTHLEALARDFRAGHAQVDPRRPSDCLHCHLHSLCRIRERAPLEIPDDSVGEEDADG